MEIHMHKTLKALKKAIASGNREDILAAREIAHNATSPEQITTWLSSEELDSIDAASLA